MGVVLDASSHTAHWVSLSLESLHVSHRVLEVLHITSTTHHSHLTILRITSVNTRHGIGLGHDLIELRSHSLALHHGRIIHLLIWLLHA